jgi:hypothetical protein
MSTMIRTICIPLLWMSASAKLAHAQSALSDTVMPLCR